MYLQMGKVMTVTNIQNRQDGNKYLQECQAEVGEQAQKQEEEVKQLERVKEGLLLDKDILNQLKVKTSQMFFQFILRIIFW